MDWGMRPNLPPQPGGWYPSFPPGGHMPPYGGRPPRMIPSYPMHGPPPPHPAMQPHMMHQMSPSHNMEWGMRPNLPPQPGGGYPSFPSEGHMPPYGGMPPHMIPSYPMHGPPPPHPAMQPHMRYQMPPSHNMDVMPMRQPYNMMRGAHLPPQGASLATNMVGSGEQVASAVPNPSFPVTAPSGNVQEMQHPPGTPSPFPYPPQVNQVLGC